MANTNQRLISIVIPIFNEQAGVAPFYQALCKCIDNLTQYKFEIIYTDDGSIDNTCSAVQKLASKDSRVKVVSLTRNFGKEIATTAGIHAAAGNAVLTIDADGQHPVEYIPQFLKAWEAGIKVVIGLRMTNSYEGRMKRYGSKLFYPIFNRLTGLQLVAGATDFRLIDETVRADFVRMTEHNRIARGLIDWLGYKRTYIPFDAKARLQDSASYSFRKLFKLAIDSIISLSISPLYFAAYVGAIVLPLSFLLGLTMLINKIFGDPLGWHASGSAYVMVFTLFLVGMLIISQAIIGLYLTHIHSETQNRPLYIIDREASRRV